MGRKKLINEEKARALALLEKGESVIAVARDVGVSRVTIYQLRRLAGPLPPGSIPQRKSGSGARKKTTPRTDTLLKHEVRSNPTITAVELKSKYPKLFENVAARTIRHRLQKDLGLPSRRAAQKPMHTKPMKKKRLAIYPKMLSNIATEEANIKQEDGTAIYFEESCWSPETCLDERSKSDRADGNAAASAAVGAEADPVNNFELVEVKEEKLDDLITVKSEPLHCQENLLLETVLVTGRVSEEDKSWRSPASAGKLATCPPVPCGEGSSSVEENTALSDSEVKAVCLNDMMRVEGTLSLFRYNCALCHYASNSKITYKMHLTTHENRPKTFSCSQCDFRSCYKASLERHLLTHGKKRAKNFSCLHCSYKTDRPDSLRIHKLIHLPNRDKPYSCANCDFKTASKGTLAIHVKIHDTNREKNKFSCTHCLYSTHNKVNLRYHMRIHDSNLPKPFECPHCDFRTDFKYRLRTHLLSHEKGSKRLACALCPFATNYESNYKKHLLSHDS